MTERPSGDIANVSTKNSPTKSPRFNYGRQKDAPLISSTFWRRFSSKPACGVLWGSSGSFDTYFLAGYTMPGSCAIRGLHSNESNTANDM